MNAHFATREEILECFHEVRSRNLTGFLEPGLAIKVSRTRPPASFVRLPALTWEVPCPRCGGRTEVRQGFPKPVHFGRCAGNVVSFPEGMGQLLDQAAE
jgi:hypothetical protein